MTLPTKLVSKMKKLLTLSREGVGGEAANAQKMLFNYLEKCGYSLAQFEDLINESTVKMRKFYRFDEFEEKLLFQISFRVTNAKHITYSEGGTQKYVWIELSDEDYARVKHEFEIYKKKLREEFAVTFHAFLTANNIFSARSEREDEDESETELTPEELDILVRASKRMASIEPTPVHIAIDRS